jgi:hypothetical protein
MSRRLIGDRSYPKAKCQTMKLKCAAILLVSAAFAAPVVAGTFEDAVDAQARGDYAKACVSYARWPMMATPQLNSILS